MSAPPSRFHLRQVSLSTQDKDQHIVHRHSASTGTGHLLTYIYDRTAHCTLKINKNLWPIKNAICTCSTKPNSCSCSTGVFIRVMVSPQPNLLPFQLFFQSREQVVVRRGQIQRIGWVIKTMEDQVGQFLLGCKCLVSCFLPGWTKDLPAPL
jgi:hypothetical protein